MVFAVPAFSQSNIVLLLPWHRGNKIVLLGEWKAEDIAKWKQLIGSEEIYGHAFTLLDGKRFEPGIALGLEVTNIGAFERWVRQHYGLGGRARWAALDNEEKLIASGMQMPSPKEFDQMLLTRGVKTPLRRVRDFLKENPGHLDAMADLLKECRRRALRLMSEEVAEELNDETDLRVWGVMASETDKVFSGPWLGIGLNFFSLGQAMPEMHSKLMRDVFRKHIAKIEQAIMLEPTNKTLWNIWVWMAQGIGDYKWEKFISGIEPVAFSVEILSLNSMPSSEAAVWLVGEAKARKDWNTVVKLARLARAPILGSLADRKTEWEPMSSRRFLEGEVNVSGHPIQTAYVPHLEALLTLGDIDEANRVYDEMIRIVGRGRGAEAAASAADVARSMGHEDLAKQWAQGKLVNPVPSMFESLNPGGYFIMISERFSSEFANNIQAMLNKLCLLFIVHALPHYSTRINTGLDWKEGENKWALISGDRRILFEGSTIPDSEEFQSILTRLGIKGDIELYRQYIEDHGSTPGIEISLAFRIIKYLRYDEENANSPDNVRNEALAFEATKYLNRVMRDNPDVLINLPRAADFQSDLLGDSDLTKSIKFLMNSTPRPLLSNIESLLERKPSAENLWEQWMLWNGAGEVGRSLESLAESVKPSPLSGSGILGLPNSVIDAYLKECRKNGSWSKAAALLKTAWDREYSRVAMPGDPKTLIMTNDTLGDSIGIYLIEAYLNDGKPGEADEIFRSVVEFGGRFKNISQILALAKAKGHDRVAAQWEAAVAKAGK